MEKSSEEYKRFDKVIREVLLPIVEENKDDIQKILDSDPKLKSRVEKKVQKILQKRNEKSKQ